MEIKQYVTDYLKSNMYLVTENNHSVLIDPSADEKLAEKLNKKGIALDHILLTHEHYDHINGVNWWKERYPEAEVMCSEVCAQRIESPRANSSRYFEAFCQIQTWAVDQKPMPSTEFSAKADKTYTDGFSMTWQGHMFLFRECPGHSPGSVLIFLDETLMFSGDSLMRDHLAATRFPGGSTKIYNEKTLPRIMGLSGKTYVYPGHMKPFFLSDSLEWKQNHNKDTEKR